MSIIAPRDWRELARQYQSADPFPSICLDNFLKPEFLDSVISAYPNYNSAKAIGREFSAINENKKVQITDPRNFPEPLKQLSSALASEEFICNLETLTGIKGLVWDPTFAGGGMHLTNNSGILDVHVDFNFEKKLGLFRRLNILIYLNKEWQASWGGSVELWNKNVTKCVQTFSPVANRCVIFSTSDVSFHGVTAVSSPGTISRNSFAVYYYSENAGDNSGALYGGNHTTIFKARPTEYIKKYFTMPMEKAKNNIKNIKKTIRDLVKGNAPTEDKKR